MTHTPTSLLLLAATAANGMLVGASLDQSLKQLPARHRIGMVAYSQYSRAADLGNGIAYYGVLGIGSALLTALATLSAHRDAAATPMVRWLDVGALLTLLHSLATSRAAPTNFSQRDVAPDDAEALTQMFDQFTYWQTIRAALQVGTLAAHLLALHRMLRTHHEPH
jgi:hypothetical protein